MTVYYYRNLLQHLRYYYQVSFRNPIFILTTFGVKSIESISIMSMLCEIYFDGQLFEMSYVIKLYVW